MFLKATSIGNEKLLFSPGFCIFFASVVIYYNENHIIDKEYYSTIIKQDIYVLV